ncbi:MAG: PGF-CTERM sorting domain-containing protein, partial [Salinarchaeum sp.]
GRTVPVTTTIRVPSETNYYLDATLWRDDVVIGSTRGAASLDPQRTVSVDTRQEDVGFNAEDFETDRRRPTAEDDASDRGATPGMGALGALIAALSAIALATYRQRNP